MYISSNMLPELFNRQKAVLAMVHVQALPGSPYHRYPVNKIIQTAVDEARLLADAGFDALIVENMHDRPYLNQRVGPETISSMTAVVEAVRQAVELPLGVQVLAGANREALAVALAGGAVFIRAENFVYAHVADEGLMPSASAGPLLRYRRELGAEHIKIFADIKKKHAAHALTADIEVAEAARSAAFCGADAVVITGTSTGQPTSIDDVRQAGAAVELPLAIGSGLNPDLLPQLWESADIFIVGSFLKKEGLWHMPPDPDRIAALMRTVKNLR
jgi:hypothetical protein